MSRVAGIIFPIPKDFVDRLLVENRNVFVKYLARSTGLRIIPKHKVLFYASHGSKEIVGEGQIEKIEFLTPTEVLTKYGLKTFLDKDELTTYTFRQPKRDSSKKLLVLVLSKIKRYRSPVKYWKPISMAGQYLTREEYMQLLK